VAADVPQTSPATAQRARPIVRVVDSGSCTLCGSCVDACVRGVISLLGTVVIDTQRCRGCGDCVEACPQGVLELVEA
jgi:heterodisulfide reductase subunit A-like polyferredoxin